MKIWISKYALTAGIYAAEAKINGDMVVCGIDPKGRHCFNMCFHGEGREWHRTEAEAIDRAEDMRTRKIKSLQKQLAKVSNMAIKSYDYTWERGSE